MLCKLIAAVTLLSALNNYYASAAVVSLLMPIADPNVTLTGNFLGTDTEGHTSWSIGVVSPSTYNGAGTLEVIGGTLVAGPTDIHQVAVTTGAGDGLSYGGTATVDCSLPTSTNDGAVVGNCDVALNVAVVSGTATLDAFSMDASDPLATGTITISRVAVHIPDSGSGALPTATSTANKNGAAGGILAGTSGWGVAGAAGLVLVGVL